MSDSQKDQAERNGAEAEGNEGGGQKVDRRTFATAEEAKAAGKAADNQRLFQVSTGEGGPTLFCYARHSQQATCTVAAARGWKATAVTGGSAKDKAKAAALLAGMSPEDRALLIQQYVPAPAQEPAKEPAPAKGKGKGK
jgi:hypothetical protein